MLCFCKTINRKDVKQMKIKEIVYEILKELSCEKDFKDCDSLQENLMLDSLSMVTLLVEIEEALNIQLDESDMNPFDLTTVGDVVHLAERYEGESDE